MILDHLINARLYYGVHPLVRKGLEYLAATDLAALKLGKTVIDGDRLFILVQDYATKPDSEGRYESHRKYWDIQYLVRGDERMGYAPLPRLTVTEPYLDERDVAFYEGQGDCFTVRAGMFAVFAPQDGHMPGLQVNGPEPVRKTVIKVRVESP